MTNWNHTFRKNTGLSAYVWVVLYILPFYFIFRSTSTLNIVFGIAMIIVFFVCYVLSFVSKGGYVYFWASVQIAVSIAMSLQFGYVYFSLFLALFIGHLKNRAAFITLYTVHLVTTFAAVNYGFATRNPVLFTQLPFVFLTLIAVVLLPVSTYNKNKEDQLQGQLDDANKRIAELVKLEERQRIARDLHDTLGQKLSLIGLKSDLAGKLIAENPARARSELRDIQQTARTALKEVREMVTRMRGTKLDDELFRVGQMLKAAQIEFSLEGDPKRLEASPIAENVVSMCLKEAITNVVKHSGATRCAVSIEPSPTELVVKVSDNGVGMKGNADRCGENGHGLQGMKERLEFVNGSLDIVSDQGTTLSIRVPTNGYASSGEEGQG